jgi:hypothetical protein
MRLAKLFVDFPFQLQFALMCCTKEPALCLLIGLAATALTGAG